MVEQKIQSLNKNSRIKVILKITKKINKKINTH